MTDARRPPRSALPLPRYVRRKRLKSGVHGYFFSVPTTWRRAGCTMADEALGVNYDEAVRRAETILLPALDAWQRTTPTGRRSLPGRVVANSRLIGGVEAIGEVDPGTVQPLIGVYLLMHRGALIYIGSSLHMPNRVAQHRANGRPFDKVHFIATKANERGLLEQTLIRALHPSQNRAHRTRPDHQGDDHAVQ